ncbi:MAG: tRNA (adenosine(37)-N6)-threonylcarbamoyltransferase complex transferase subunit TsaD, partial [Pseudomonadota bacterium]|nr:tRNA (adenosine(37)-N6)-threonylcarbamoyltransferase complex transferase subunit TsaD [Pseudomonadota bacterium]
MTVLGLETSCDETAAAIVRLTPDNGRTSGVRGDIMANVVLSQIDVHAPYGGVVPELAARAHIDHLDRMVAEALAEAGCKLQDMDAIAATAGPGLIGGVLIGLTTGKALALASGAPFYGINHLEGHALTARLTHDVAFPYLLLLVSGGHCQLCRVDGVGDYTLVGSTRDDAVGEAFDKAAKLLGLGYPGGPKIEARAAR